MWLEKVFSFNRKKVPQVIVAYALDERRTSRYTFTSLKALRGYFNAWLAEEEIEDLVEKAKLGFTPRAGCSEDETRLQFLKKCEYQMVRLLRNGAAAA
jgi:hypothetical protein